MIIAHVKVKGRCMLKPFQFQKQVLNFWNWKRFAFNRLLSSRRSEMNIAVASFFKMMKVGAAHLLSLIRFNTPSLMSLSNSTFRVRSCIFGTGKGLLW